MPTRGVGGAAPGRMANGIRLAVAITAPSVGFPYSVRRLSLAPGTRGRADTVSPGSQPSCPSPLKRASSCQPGGKPPGHAPRLVDPHTTRAGHERRRAVPRTTDPGYGRQPYRPAAADLAHQPGASTPVVVCPRGGWWPQSRFQRVGSGEDAALLRAPAGT